MMERLLEQVTRCFLFFEVYPSSNKVILIEIRGITAKQSSNKL